MSGSKVTEAPFRIYETRDDVVRLIRGRLTVARDQERLARKVPGMVEPGTAERWQARQAALRELLQALGEWQREEPDDVR